MFLPICIKQSEELSYIIPSLNKMDEVSHAKAQKVETSTSCNNNEVGEWISLGLSCPIN